MCSPERATAASAAQGEHAGRLVAGDGHAAPGGADDDLPARRAPRDGSAHVYPQAHQPAPPARDRLLKRHDVASGRQGEDRVHPGGARPPVHPEARDPGARESVRGHHHLGGGDGSVQDAQPPQDQPRALARHARERVETRERERPAVGVRASTSVCPAGGAARGGATASGGREGAGRGCPGPGRAGGASSTSPT